MFACILIAMMLISLLSYNIDVVSAESEENAATELHEERQSESEEEIEFESKGIFNSNYSSTFGNNGVAVSIDPNLKILGITDELDGASIVINNFNSGDQLNFTNTENITGEFNRTNGVLVLKGSASSVDYQEALRSVLYSTISENISDRTFTFNLGSSLSYNNHYYEFIKASGISWTEARVAAEAKSFFGRKGYLATVTTQGENDFIKEKTSGNGWIGASDYYTELNRVSGKNYSNQNQAEGQWYWVTGPETGTQFWQGGSYGSSVDGRYENWYVDTNGVRGEPNNSGGEHYAHILGTDGAFWNNNDPAGYGKWNDFPDSLPERVEGYIVEYGGMEGDNEDITISTSKVSKFDSTSNDLTPLEKVNAAKKTNSNENALAAITNPALDLSLPNDFLSWGTDLKNSVAETVMYIIDEDYESKAQVQYVVDLATFPMIAFDDIELDSINNNLITYFTMFAQSKEIFPSNDQFESLSQMGESYVNMSDIDKSIFAYRTKFHFLNAQITRDQILETLTATFSTYRPINRVIKKVDMYNILVNLRLLQKESSQLILDYPQYGMDIFALDLKKVDDPDFTFARYQELAQWMINQRPEKGYANYLEIQMAFDRFFTPSTPNVSGNDVTNKLIGADETMEYSTDSGISWTTYTEQEAPIFIGNVTVKIRVKANGNIPAGEITTVTFTANNLPPVTPSAPNVNGDDVTNKLIGVDNTMEYSTDGGVSWINYNPEQAPTFTGNVTVQIRVKATGSTPFGKVAVVIFTKNPASSSEDNGGQSSSSSNTEKIVVDVDGKDGTNLTKTPITRTTDSSGKVKDHVSMSEDIAKETVNKAKQQGTDTARIIIPDTNDKVSEVVVEIPKTALKQLNDGKMKLEIATENAVISIPTNSLSTFNEDLYFKVVPIKSKEQQNLVEERAKKEKLIQDVAKNQTVQLLGRPMEIDTNMQSREVSIVLPLKEGLPTDAKARGTMLENLVIFVEHSDGTKEIVRGKVVPYQKDSELGLEFSISKFSTFSIVYMDGAKAFFDGKGCGTDTLSASSIGCLSIKKSVPVYELVNNRLKKVDVLKEGQAVPAYDNISPMLGLGGDIWVERTNAIRYETPSKSMLEKNALTGTSRQKQIWKGLELRPGQIGKVTILADTVIWEKINKTNKIARILKKGEQYRVYRYVPGMYSIGNGKYVVQGESVILQKTK